MTEREIDRRSIERRARDEQIASQPPLAPLELGPEATASPMESHLSRQHRRPLAVAGVVENGLVRPLDPSVRLREKSRVIIIASDDTA